MWIGESAGQHPEKLAQFYQRLREMGVNTAMVYGSADPGPLVDNKFPYYVENMVNRGLCLKFNAKVRDWDKFVTDWARGGRPESALAREYCLDDPQWRAWGRNEMQSIARKNRENQPLAYDIRDELSTTFSANPFDYDFGPLSLKGFREWLITQYANLAALNAQWETKFATWEEVKPFTTDQVKSRMAGGDPFGGKPDWQAVQGVRFEVKDGRQFPSRWNFAPWADFRTYMDLALAGALDDFRRAAREIDPQTPVGIEGMQMPHAFGGYDLWRLSQALDWAEPYDIGNAREILGSFMPGKAMVTTLFESDPDHARRRLWHLLLCGDRACIIWWSEDCVEWKEGQWQLAAKARALTPVLNEMTSPLARLFLRAKPERDPIYIHYSQPSIQVDWLLESTVDGSTWLRRFSSFEADHNRMAKARNGWLKACQDSGWSPQFISSAQIEAGALGKLANGVLTLPMSWALSDKEAAEIRSFLKPSEAKRTREVLFDTPPGLFDQHGRLRTEGLFEEIPAAGGGQCVVLGNGRQPGFLPGDAARYATQRLKDGAAMELSSWMARELKAVRPEIRVPAAARARVHRFRSGPARLIAIERNVDYQMSEDLSQAGGNEALEKPVELDVTLARAQHVYDLRTRKYLGLTDRIHLKLDPWQPSLFALTETQLPAENIIAALSKK